MPVYKMGYCVEHGGSYLHTPFRVTDFIERVFNIVKRRIICHANIEIYVSQVYSILNSQERTKLFSTGHIFFIVLSFILILLGSYLCRRYNPPAKKLFCICFVLSVLSEVIKFFSSIKIMPVVMPVIENGKLIYQETGNYAPYLEPEHLPFELCSYQILFIFLLLVIKNETWKKRLCMFMYTTCIIGGFMGIVFSSAVIEFSDMLDIITSVDVWRSFIYHSMLVVLGIYIGYNEECDIHFRDIKWTFIILIALDCMTFYLNSAMTIPYYQGDDLVGIGNVVNYFSSYNNPLGIVMRNKYQWIIYLGIRFLLAIILMILVNLPLLKKERK